MTSNILTLALSLAATALHAAQPYTVVDTGQTKCYDNFKPIAPPQPGEAFHGQDAQFHVHPASYTLAADGLTVQDGVTGLTWQRSPDTDGNGVLNRSDKLTLTQAQALPAKLNAAKFGGFDDWRLPSIKELYSLFDGRGTDPSGPAAADTSALTPFIDTKFFKFAYGNTRTGERVIDSQYASNTKFVGKGARGFDKLFGVNFADGRIKGYDLKMPGGGMEKTFFVQCVRGNANYGKNDYHDNSDGTVTDRATGLMWSKDDSAKGMNWQDALAWVRKKNAGKFLGHDDWRLPSVKELQSIVDYSRAPDTTQSPAIDPVFTCTSITNEGGKPDWPYYWSATTHSGFQGGAAAMYVAFGRAAGWMSAQAMAGGPPERRGPGAGGPPGRPPLGPPGAVPSGTPGGDYHFTDVHGAGAQRSDPKVGDPALFPHGRGPQGDVIRINNLVRCVRNTTPLNPHP
ncbi:MAG: DUF1566 domain-containing protein [Verrucomicrobia bacterium]|nr:DUF1566 domain-containing protein [Verrucomicrobiota bacterium]